VGKSLHEERKRKKKGEGSLLFQKRQNEQLHIYHARNSGKNFEQTEKERKGGKEGNFTSFKARRAASRSTTLILAGKRGDGGEGGEKRKSVRTSSFS